MNPMIFANSVKDMVESLPFFEQNRTGGEARTHWHSVSHSTTLELLQARTQRASDSNDGSGWASTNADPVEIHRNRLRQLCMPLQRNQ
jgi:hypothetical protein